MSKLTPKQIRYLWAIGFFNSKLAKGSKKTFSQRIKQYLSTLKSKVKKEISDTRASQGR